MKLWGGLSADVGAGPGPPGIAPEQEGGNFAASYVTLGALPLSRGGVWNTALGSPAAGPQGLAFLGEVSPGGASQTAS